MPIYEYICQKCGEFEVTQRITEKPLGKCPTCKGKVKKLISNTSFQLKGTGWYVTDYARKGQNGDTKKDGDSKKDSPAKTDSTTKSGSESKSESKSEGKKSETSSSTSGSDKSSPSTPSSPSTT